MPRFWPAAETLKASEVRQQWREVVNKVARKEARVVVEKNGVPVAAIVSADDLARLQQFNADREQAFAALERVGAAFNDVPLEELEREVAKAIAEVRAENRAKLCCPDASRPRPCVGVVVADLP